MKTTVDLPADLVKALKLHALNRRRKLGESVVELLRLASAADGGAGRPGNQRPHEGTGMSGSKSSGPTHRRNNRVQLPLIHCGHCPPPDQQLTPDQIAGLLLNQEADSVNAPARR